MKTNRFARGFLKMRMVLLCAALLGLALVGSRVGDTLSEVQGQAAASQTEVAPPSIDISKFIAAAR